MGSLSSSHNSLVSSINSHDHLVWTDFAWLCRHFIVNNQPLHFDCKLEIIRELQAVEDDIQIFIDAGILKIYIWQSADWAMR